ncbi:MAG: hypothetical protein RMM31_02100 [Anaerolineae bacterium]|nr:hypothetical protein [Thermoflexales bacterium]MDW8395015.1 hypothetical protein [Anaerolineae bacterium]
MRQRKASSERSRRVASILGLVVVAVLVVSLVASAVLTVPAP